MNLRFSSFLLAMLAATAGATSVLAACSSDPAAAPDLAAEPDADKPRPRKEAGADVDAPPRDVAEMKYVDLGAVAVGQEVTLDVPAGALGFNIVVEGAVNGSVGIEEIRSPSGEVVHADYTPSGGTIPLSYSERSRVNGVPFAAASVPQSESASANPPAPGKWKIRFGSAADPGEPPPPPPLDGGGAGDAGTTPATMHAEARIQMGAPSGFEGGRLDVRVFVPGGLSLEKKTLNATSAKTDEDIAFRLETFAGGLKDLFGLDLGTVTFLPASSDLVYIDNDDRLDAAFAASKGLPDAQVLNLFLTNGIDFGGGGGAWGIASGIPGAATRSGTSMSGIVVAIGDTPSIGDGLTILHEAGHFFGLNHTTEFVAGYSDPLSDTPICTGLNLEDPSSLGKCPDKRNLMFPTFYGTTEALAVETSKSQRNVLHGSPVFKAYRDRASATMSAETHRRELRAPLTRAPLTKSGRALDSTEQLLAQGLCIDSVAALHADPSIPFAHADAATVARLRRASTDADLPAMLRRKASAVLLRLGRAN